MSAISNPYFAELAHAIEQEAADAGYSLLLADTHDDPERELRATRDLLGRRVDGVILAPSAQPAAALDLLAQARYSDRADRPVHPCRARPDRDREHRADGPPGRAPGRARPRAHRHDRRARGLATSEERIDGYRRGLASASLPFDPSSSVAATPTPSTRRAAVHRLLDLDRPPTALVVTNNRMTIGAMRALREASLWVPERHCAGRFRRFRVGRPLPAAADDDRAGEHADRRAVGGDAALPARQPRARGPQGPARAEVRAPRVVWLPRRLNPSRLPARTTSRPRQHAPMPAP